MIRNLLCLLAIGFITVQIQAQELNATVRITAPKLQTTDPQVFKTMEQAIAEVGGQQFGQFKPALAELAVEKLAPISSEMARLMADPAEIDRILAHGAGQAREITAPILKKTYEIMGMVGA